MQDYRQFPMRVTRREDGAYCWQYDMRARNNRSQLKFTVKRPARIFALAYLVLEVLVGITAALVFPDILSDIPRASLPLLPLAAIVCAALFGLFMALVGWLLSLLSWYIDSKKSYMMTEHWLVRVQSELSQSILESAIRDGADTKGKPQFSRATRMELKPDCDCILLFEGRKRLALCFVPPEDYAFVKDFLCAHLPEGAEITGG